jgi:hypothetical protein
MNEVNGDNESKWSRKMLMIYAVLIDLVVFSCFIIMPLFKFLRDIFKLIYLTIVSCFLLKEKNRKRIIKDLSYPLNEENSSSTIVYEY